VSGYGPISTAVPFGEALFVENSIAVRALANIPSILNTIAVAVKPVMYYQSNLAGRTAANTKAPVPQALAPKPQVRLGTFNANTICYAPNSDQLEQCRTYYTYTAGTGESLISIAQRVYGDQSKWKIIYAANRAVIGSNPNLIKPGVELALPSQRGPTIGPRR
jgi:nucleoid-associated protein YgaU